MGFVSVLYFCNRLLQVYEVVRLATRYTHACEILTLNCSSAANVSMSVRDVVIKTVMKST